MGNNVSKQISAGLDDFAAVGENVVHQITEDVGAVGQGIGDLFYYDNPKRRDRVEQLRNDINTSKADFDSLKMSADEVVERLEPKVDKPLRDNGFKSADDMDHKMKERLDPEALRKWEEFKKTLNQDIVIENLIVTVTGLVTIFTGVISGILVVFDAITAATGGSALGGFLAPASSIIASLVVILALVDAPEERGCRNCEMPFTSSPLLE